MDQLSAGLNSIRPFLPVSISTTSSSAYHLTWPEEAENSLKQLKLGPNVSRVYSGASLFRFICKMREELGLSPHPLAYRCICKMHEDLGFSSEPPLASGANHGLSIYFNQCMSRDDAKLFFDNIVPGLAKLVLQLPSLLEAHYHKSNDKSELPILSSQDSGIVILNRELIAALVACGFLCLYPAKDRNSKRLPVIINFDQFFAAFSEGSNKFEQQKLKCFIEYFERICRDTPNGTISFERKVLASKPDADFWKNSATPLCPIKMFTSGSIEDQSHEALEVVFSSEHFGGKSLSMGCVQEQIRFMINPELVGGMLFLACMEDNEAIEVVGVERYIQYTGYSYGFRFLCPYVDHKPFDSMERRKTRIVAMDALKEPLEEPYSTKYLLREMNKGFAGFQDSKYEATFINFQVCKPPCEVANTCSLICNEKENRSDKSQFSRQGNRNEDGIGIGSDNEYTDANNVGIATGDWLCGLYGGNPEIKCIIQWIAASQTNRPFINYYRFNEYYMQRAEQVIEYITRKKWNVGDLWTKLLEYSSRKLEGETNEDLFSWLLPAAENSNIGHGGYNALSGSKRSPEPTQQDDRPNRVKRQPAWLDDYDTMMS